MPEFWKTAGYELLELNPEGELKPTRGFFRAYLRRPELKPVDESCDAEIALYDELVQDPFVEVASGRIAGIADADAQENFRMLLTFRDLLIKHGTLEGAYLAIMRSEAVTIPPLFISQMVHVILRNILADCADPIRVRAAELFFREQQVSTDEGRIVLADDEIVEMYAATGGMGGLGQLLAEANTAAKSVELDVLDEDNKEIYWQRSDRFDTVIDIRFTQPALDAIARVMEAWISHFLKVRTRIQPMQNIDDENWLWHIGLDVDATRILNALYHGKQLSLDELQKILALFRLEILDGDTVQAEVRGKPVYLALAMTGDRKLRMKPQNLLTNLPLIAGF
ncbi:MAG: DUF6352 family protein [Hyphomicrobiales bacterium]